MLTQMTDISPSQLMAPVQNDPMLICLLGRFRLLRHGQPLDALIAGKAMTLLSTLALHVETGVPRDALLDLLWPERDGDQAAASLHSLIYGLHRRLHIAARGASMVVYANGSYALNRAAGVNTDIVRFDSLIAEGNRLAAARADVEAASHYEHALALYRGDLSIGTDIYTVIERERLRANFLTVLAWLADQSYRAGDFAAAVTHASRLLAYDPCREDAHRVIMRTHVHRGERAQALRQYHLCLQVLRREFDAAPEAVTTALYDRIRGNPESV